MLYTIGHSNHSIQQFISMLKVYQIKILLDVRGKPQSRYCPHFNRAAFEESLKAAGIEYYWGGKYLDGFTEETTKLPEFVEKMEKSLSLHRQKGSLAYMCSEKDVRGCHRGMKLAAWLHRNTDNPITHIYPDGWIDSRVFESLMPSTWLHFDFGGEYIANTSKKMLPLNPHPVKQQETTIP